MSAGIYFTDPEITPSGRGQYRYNAAGDPVESFPPEVEVRALVEGQIMAKLHHAQLLGYEITPFSRVLATGGASKNSHIRQVRKMRVWHRGGACGWGLGRGYDI